jgi:hypothetical protein
VVTAGGGADSIEGIACCKHQRNGSMEDALADQAKEPGRQWSAAHPWNVGTLARPARHATLHKGSDVSMSGYHQPPVGQHGRAVACLW